MHLLAKIITISITVARAFCKTTSARIKIISLLSKLDKADRKVFDVVDFSYNFAQSGRLLNLFSLISVIFDL